MAMDFVAQTLERSHPCPEIPSLVHLDDIIQEDYSGIEAEPGDHQAIVGGECAVLRKAEEGDINLPPS